MYLTIGTFILTIPMDRWCIANEHTLDECHLENYYRKKNWNKKENKKENIKIK